MHLMREGLFDVATSFIKESETDINHDVQMDTTEPGFWDQGFDDPRSETLRFQFKEMYDILEEMRARRNLEPATIWARVHSAELEARGSNLEFDLARLKFVWLFNSSHFSDGYEDDPWHRQRSAIEYARDTFSMFQERYLREVQQLLGAMAFGSNLRESPYSHLFVNDSAWEQLALSFTREFCSLLGLSSDSPVYIAATAGAIALPRLQKLEKIMESRRANWTTQSELPVSSQFRNCCSMTDKPCTG